MSEQQSDETAQCRCVEPTVACPSCLARRDRNGWPKDWQGRMRDGWHDLMRPGDDCGGTPDWCLAPNGVECAQHDENGDRRG